MIRVRLLSLVFLLTILSSVIPYVLNIGQGNVFINDFYAKRIMAILTLPFLGVLLFSVKKWNKWILLYLFYVFFQLVLSLSNDVKYLMADLYVSLLPAIFYLVTASLFNENSLGFRLNKLFPIVLIIAVVISSFNIKLQLSYLSLLGILYILYYQKFKYRHIFLWLLIPLALYFSLLGKSSLILFFIGLCMIYFLEKKFVPQKRKLFVILLIVVSVVIGGVISPEIFKSSSAYKHFDYFLSNAEISELSFKDDSTSQRIYEAELVLESYFNQNLLQQLFGNGFGAVLDMSDSPDSTIEKTNVNTVSIHHIHISIFAILYRNGIVTLFVYFTFIVVLLYRAIGVFKFENSKYMHLSAIYVFMMVFDSFVSFPHLMSNYFFWFAASIILLSKNINYTNNAKITAF